MSYTFLSFALVVALVDWIAVYCEWKTVRYITKPGVMILLLVWLWQAGGFAGHTAWFAFGLFFSMLGDIFLMLPEERFIPGLVAFLLAHLAYLVGFNQTFPPLNLASLILAVWVGFTAAQLYHAIATGLESSGKSNLKPPVLVYSTVISLMVLFAMLTMIRSDQEWLAGPALLVSAGAMLFFLSDTFLAWNRFVSSLSYGDLRVIITYHLGQVLIVLGAALQFLKLN